MLLSPGVAALSSCGEANMLGRSSEPPQLSGPPHWISNSHADANEPEKTTAIQSRELHNGHLGGLPCSTGCLYWTRIRILILAFVIFLLWLVALPSVEVRARADTGSNAGRTQDIPLSDCGGTRVHDTRRFRSSVFGYPHLHETREETLGIVDKAKDKAQEAKGDVKDKVGKATDDESLQAEGKGDKVSGNLKQAGEKVKDAL